MILKAIVESYPDENSRVRIRIPKFHKLKNVATSTPTDELPFAPTCSLPGIKPFYTPGEIVFIDFENDDPSKPVVVGKLNYKSDTSNSISDITASTLKVQSNTILSDETRVGNINYSDLDYTVNGFINAPDSVSEYYYTDIGNGNIRVNYY